MMDTPLFNVGELSKMLQSIRAGSYAAVAGLCIGQGSVSSVTVQPAAFGKHWEMHQSWLSDKYFQIQAGFCPGKPQIQFVITQ